MANSIIDYMNGKRDKKENPLDKIKERLQANGSWQEPVEGESDEDFYKRYGGSAAMNLATALQRQQEQKEAQAQRDQIYKDYIQQRGPTTAQDIAQGQMYAGDVAHGNLPQISATQAWRNQYTPSTQDILNEKTLTAQEKQAILAQKYAGLVPEIQSPSSRYSTVTEKPSQESDKPTFQEIADYTKAMLANQSLVNSAAQKTTKDYLQQLMNPAYQAAINYQKRAAENAAKEANQEATKRGLFTLRSADASNEYVRELQNSLDATRADAAKKTWAANALNDKTREMELAPYNLLAYNKDFNNNSGYKKDGASRITEVVNGAEVYDREPNSEELDLYSRLLPEERSIYNYLLNTKGYDGAKEYLEALTPDLKQRRTDYLSGRAYQWANKNALTATAASAGTVALNAMRIAGTVGATVDKLTKGIVDTNAAYNLPSQVLGAARQGAGARYGEDIGNIVSWAYKKAKASNEDAANAKQTTKGVVEWLYPGIMSSLDSAWNGTFAQGVADGLFGLDFQQAREIVDAAKNGAQVSSDILKAANKTVNFAENFARIIMGAEVVPDAIQSAKERGLSDDQAYAIGMTNGLAEYISEAVSIGNLMETDWTKKGVKNFLLNQLKQRGSEALEEVESGVIDWAADVIIAKDKSEWQQKLQKYNNDPNVGPQKAFGAALADTALEIGSDALSAFLTTGNEIISEYGKQKVYQSQFKLHNKFNELDKNTGTSYIDDWHGLLAKAITADDSTRADAVADYVRAVQEAFPDDTAKRAVEFINEARAMETNKSVRDELGNISDVLRRNLKTIQSSIDKHKTGSSTVVNTSAASNTAKIENTVDTGTKPIETITSDQATDTTRLATHTNIEELDKSDGEDRTGSLNMLIDTAADMAGDDRLNALAHLVDEMSELYGDEAFERTLDYINERVQIDNQLAKSMQEQYQIDDVTTDATLMKELSNELRNNRQSVMDLVRDIQNEGIEPRYTRATPENRPHGTYRFANNDKVNEAIDQVVEADVSEDEETPAPELVEFVNTVAEEAEPGENPVDAAIEAVENKIEETQNVIESSAESEVSNETPDNNVQLEEVNEQDQRVEAYQKLLGALNNRREQLEESVTQKTEPEETEWKYVFDSDDYTHTKTGEEYKRFVPTSVIDKNIRNQFSRELFELTKGYWSPYAKGFLIPTKGLDSQKWNDVRKLLIKYGIKISNTDMSDNAYEEAIKWNEENQKRLDEHKEITSYDDLRSELEKFGSARAYVGDSEYQFQILNKVNKDTKGTLWVGKYWIDNHRPQVLSESDTKQKAIDKTVDEAEKQDLLKFNMKKTSEDTGKEKAESDVSDIANDKEVMDIIEKLPKPDPAELEHLYDASERVLIKGSDITPDKIEQLLKLGTKKGDRIVFNPESFRGVVKGDTKFQNAAAKHTFIDLTNGNFVVPKFSDGWTEIQFDVNPIVKQVSEILEGKSETNTETQTEETLNNEYDYGSEYDRIENELKNNNVAEHNDFVFRVLPYGTKNKEYHASMSQKDGSAPNGIWTIHVAESQKSANDAIEMLMRWARETNTLYYFDKNEESKKQFLEQQNSQKSEQQQEEKPKREPVAPTPKPGAVKKAQNTDTPYDVLSDRLLNSSEVREGQYIFTIGNQYDANGPQQYIGYIDQLTYNDESGVPVFNARKKEPSVEVYNTGWVTDRNEALNGIVDYAETNKLLDPVDNTQEQEYTESEPVTETTSEAENESEYKVGEVVQVGDEYYEVVAIEDGEPKFEPYTSEETEAVEEAAEEEDDSSFGVDEEVMYNGKKYRILRFNEDGSPVLQEVKQSRGNGSSTKQFALEAPEIITLSLSDFKNAIKNGQIKKASSSGAKQTASSSKPKPQTSTPKTATPKTPSPNTQGTASARLSLADLMKKAGTGSAIQKVDKSKLGGIKNGVRTDNAASGRKSGTVSSELDSKGQRRDGRKSPNPVQETEKTGGSEKPSQSTGSKRGETGNVQTGTVRGNADTGKSVQDQKPVSTGKSDTVDDERGNSAGNGGRVSGNDANGTGKRNTRVSKNNYSFDAEDIRYIDNTKPNERDNLEAIKTLLSIEREGRKATPEEKKILSKYKGWGGLTDIFKYSYYGNGKELKDLLSPQEYSEALASVTNAHYTSLEIVGAMYDGLKRMGLKGGNILEPSMGSGNFLGMMPKSIVNNSNLYGVEMDSITGRIAKQLYPDADITISPFQDVKYKDNQFDVIVGNVPFSPNTFTYKGEKHTLHTYFFAKSLDHLKPGGIMMAITSTGTLDSNPKSRDTLAKKADLVAAFRLPGGMFGTNAGTRVTTDLLVFRKRPVGLAQSNETFADVGPVQVEDRKTGEVKTGYVNEYFIRHPENVLGKYVQNTMYGHKESDDIGNNVAVAPIAGEDYKKILSDAMKRLPKDIIGTDMTAAEVKVENDSIKPGFIEQNGKVYFRDPSDDTLEELTGKRAAMAKDYLKIKDAYNGLIELSNDPTTPHDKLEQARKTLNDVYDAFVNHKWKNSKGETTTFGPLNKGGVGNARSLLNADADYSMVSALEVKGDEPGTYKKAPIFYTDIFAKPPVEHIDSPHDALASSLAEKGTVDLDYMEKLTGLTKDQLLEQLQDRVVETPDGEYQLAELYLSGDVRSKLEEARRAAENDEKFQKNVDMLSAVMPDTVPTESISAPLGAAWIPVSYYQNFIKDRLNAYPSTRIGYNPTTGQWVVEGGKYAFPNSVTYGNVNLAKLLEATMNQKQVQIRDNKGKLDVIATQDAQQKQKLLRNEFMAWIFATKERKAELGDLYNKTFNSWRNADYTELGKTLKFEGVNPLIKLRDYQRTAVARVVYGGNALLGHGVGTGKTFEMIASAMESKRIGITHKNLFVVPKNKVADFQRDILRLYPNAKVMRVTDQDFDTDNRKRMISALATNDYDIAVIGHTQFNKIPLSKETQQAVILEQLNEARAVLSALNEQKEKEKGKSFNRSVKDIEKTIAGYEEKLKSLSEKEKDNTVTFEKLGIDGLFVDEAHNFKNLPFFTTKNVAGVKGGDAQRATDMFMKTSWLHNKHSKVVFATATPITNTMSEIYNMTRFVSPETLKNAGIQSFDAWASVFGETTNSLEVSPDGKNFRMKERFAKFRNAQQMISMFRQFTDILKTADVVENLPTADRITVTSPESDIQREYINNIVTRIQNMGGRASKTDNMLLITNDGKAAATDLRLVEKQINRWTTNQDDWLSMEELDLPDSKINNAVKNVLKEYKDTEKIKGTQLIFLDQGLTADDEARYGYDLYTDIINKLVEGGIKPEEIVRIDKVPVKKLEDLFDKMRSGEVRVLIGTTMRMGEGLNIQDRIVAMHELTPPAKPSGIEQSEGRAIRSGNINKNVRIYRYIQEGSFDSYLWQQLERKGRFINVAMSGGAVNEIDDVDDFVLNAQEAKAIATGNPLLLEKAELDSKFNELESSYRLYMSQRMSAEDTMAKAPNELASAQKLLDTRKADQETVKDNPVKDNKFSIVIEGKEYTDRKSANEAIAKVFSNGKYAMNRTYDVGSARGLKVQFMAQPGSYTLSVAGKDFYTIPDAHPEGDNATRIWNQLDKVEEGKYVTPVEDRLSRIKSDIDEAKKILSTPYKQQKEYDETLARLREVNIQLAAAAGNVVEEIIDEESDDFKGKFKTEEEQYEDELAEAEESEGEDEGGTPTARRSSGRKTTTRKSLFEGRWDTERVNPANGPLSASQIQRAAGRIFNLPINTGKINYRASGIYDERAVAARIKTHGDVPNLCHEIGHYMDSLYDFSDAKAIEPVVAAFTDDLTAAGYTEEQIPSEAFAEFFRIYCKNKGEAVKQFEDFTEYFESTLSNLDKKRMAAFSGITQQYFSAVNRTRIEANVGARTERLRPSVKLNEAMDEIKSDPKGAFRVVEREAMRQWVDDLSDLKQFGNAYDKAFYEKQSRSIAEGRLTVAMTDMQGNIVGDSMATILQRGRITQENRKAFDSYLVLCRAYDQFNLAKQRGAKDPLIFADLELNDRMEIAKQIQLYERDNPTFHDTAGQLYAYQQQLLDLCVEGGLITEEFKDRLNELYPHYVPLYRVMDDKKSVLGVKGKYADQRAPIARFKGSGREIWSPLENIMMDVEKVTAATMRNAVMQEFANTIDTVSGLGHIAERVTPDMAAQRVMTDSLKNKLATLLGENANLFGGENELLNFTHLMFGEIGDVLTQWAPSAKQSRNIVSVMRNGERTYYEVHDEGVLQSLKSLNPQEMGLVNRVLTTIGRAQKALFTSLSPKFNVNNFARDTMTGLISSSSTNNAFKYMADAVNGFKDVIMDSEDFKKYRLHGGGYMNSLTYDSGTMRNIMNDMLDSNGKLRRVWEAFKRIYTASEDVTRYAEYKRNLNEGKSVMEAIRASQEISVNFARGGESAKKLNRYFLFLNAQIQGEYHVADLLKNGTRSQKLKTILYPMASALIQWLLGLFLVPWITGKKKEELIDDYADLSNWQKLNYYNIPLGDKRFFQVRKTQDFALPASLIELYVLNAIDKNSGEWNDVAGYVGEQLFPVNGNTVSNFVGVGPLLDVIANKSYTGAPIVPEYMKQANVPSELQYTPGSTSVIAIKLADTALARLLNISPNVIQYLGEEEFGFPARLINDLTRQDGDIRTGLHNFEFISDAAYSTDIINVFYDQKKKYDQAADGYKKGSKHYTLSDLYGSEKYGKYASLYSDLNRERKAEKDSGIARQMKLEINALFNTINKDGLTDIDDKVIALCERTGATPSEIAPYITIPDKVTYKDSKTKNTTDYELNFDDHYKFFLQLASKLEREYKTAFQSGYSDADLVEDLKKIKSETLKEMKEAWAEELHKKRKK